MAKKGKLSRNTNQRKALFKSLLNSLIMKEQIQTTAPKAKAIQGMFDRLLTQGKLGTLHARRLLHAFLGDQKAVNKLVDELAPRTGKRSSGFTRITKLGLRKGDNAPVVVMELVDKKPEKPAEVKEVKKKKAVKEAKSTKDSAPKKK